MNEIKYKVFDKITREMVLVDSLYELCRMNLTKEEISNKIFLQYTGLHDKNGIEIYEGDKIDHFATSGTVIFENGMFTLSSSANVNFGYKQPLCYIDTIECTVIGSIYQNPKLVEVNNG